MYIVIGIYSLFGSVGLFGFGRFGAYRSRSGVALPIALHAPHLPRHATLRNGFSLDRRTEEQVSVTKACREYVSFVLMSKNKISVALRGKSDSVCRRLCPLKITGVILCKKTS